MPADRLLCVMPTQPRPSGNGLAMRAASLLEALAERFAVDLCVLPLSGDGGPPDPVVTRDAARVGMLDLAVGLDPLFQLISRIPDPAARAQAELAYPKPFASRFCGVGAARWLEGWGRASPAAALHVMRLYLAPLAEPFLARHGADRPFCVLDLDDDEVISHERLAALHAGRGDHRAAAVAAAEAGKYRALAERYFPLFDRVLVCSESDAARLGAAYPTARFAVVPNSYRASGAPLPRQPSADGPLRLLFVGNLGYFPNLDAVMFLCREILPALRRYSTRRLRIDIAGQGDVAALRRLVRDPEVTIYGAVEALAPLYAAADVAVAPLRGGGGTRIKLLEAFAHEVPAVATRLGAEGLDLADGVHALLADDPAAFARACLRVKEEPGLAAALALQGAALLEARYSPARLAAALAGVYGALDGTV